MNPSLSKTLIAITGWHFKIFINYWYIYHKELQDATKVEKVQKRTMRMVTDDEDGQ